MRLRRKTVLDRLLDWLVAVLSGCIFTLGTWAILCLIGVPLLVASVVVVLLLLAAAGRALVLACRRWHSAGNGEGGSLVRLESRGNIR